jgi:hypothetical protein
MFPDKFLLSYGSFLRTAYRNRIFCGSYVSRLALGRRCTSCDLNLRRRCRTAPREKDTDPYESKHGGHAHSPLYPPGESSPETLSPPNNPTGDLRWLYRASGYGRGAKKAIQPVVEALLLLPPLYFLLRHASFLEAMETPVKISAWWTL